MARRSTQLDCPDTPVAQAPVRAVFRTRIPAILLLIAAAIIVYQVFIPPIVGTADNGDFSIVNDVFSVYPIDRSDADLYFLYLHEYFRRIPEEPSRFRLITSEIITGGLAFALNFLVSKDGLFDIRVMGFVHASLYLIALAILFPTLRSLNRRGQIVFGSLLLLVLCDIMPVSHFNTFYTDAGSLIFFVLSAAIYVRMLSTGRPTRGAMIAFFLSLLLFVTSKAQHALLGIPLAAFLLWHRDWFSAAGRRLFWIGTATVLAGSLACILTVPRRYSDLALYNIIFHEILPNTPEPVRELRSLGLSEEYLAYSGTGAFDARSGFRQPAFVANFSRQTSHFRLLFYYLRNPATAFRIFMKGAKEGAFQRFPGFANLPKSSGVPPRYLSQSFALWSTVKQAIFYTHPLLYVIFALAVSATLIRLLGFRSPAGSAALLLIVWTFLEIGFATLADSGETGRHLFLFNRMLDALILATLAAAAIRLRLFQPAQ